VCCVAHSHPTVDPQTPEYNPRPLVAYMEAEGIPYFYLSQVWCFTLLVAVRVYHMLSLCHGDRASQLPMFNFRPSPAFTIFTLALAR
jgi:hypothetical protein